MMNWLLSCVVCMLQQRPDLLLQRELQSADVLSDLFFVFRINKIFFRNFCELTISVINALSVYVNFEGVCENVE